MKISIGPHSSSNNQPASHYVVDESPLLETGMPNEVNGADLQDLKHRHERLVDLILKEEDDLIASHHKFIESTINSGRILAIFSQLG
jgi:hypothetical protein